MTFAYSHFPLLPKPCISLGMLVFGSCLLLQVRTPRSTCFCAFTLCGPLPAPIRQQLFTCCYLNTSAGLLPGGFVCAQAVGAICGADLSPWSLCLSCSSSPGEMSGAISAPPASPLGSPLLVREGTQLPSQLGDCPLSKLLWNKWSVVLRGRSLQ